MEFENLAIAQEGPTAIVTLNRPQRRNALSLDLMLELIALPGGDRRPPRHSRRDPGRRGRGLLLRATTSPK